MADAEESPIARLRRIMARLRDPDGGCPWDLDQDFKSIAPYTIEEAYEVADAIERDDFDELRHELGDLLLQVVYHARIAEERDLFDFDSVAESIANKMVRRHPHVFGEQEINDLAAMNAHWEATKEAEREAKGRSGALDGVARTLPATTRAAKLQKRAARVGFDWKRPADILEKIEEETDEIREALNQNESVERQQEEIGDLLFAVINLARRLDIDPETALRRANAKFEARFRAMEDALRRDGRAPSDADLEELEALWRRAKVLTAR